MSILGSLRLGASFGPRARRKGTSGLAVLGLATVGLATGAVTAGPAVADSTCPANRGVVTCTFGYTGGLQSWTVPAEAAGAPIQIVATGQAGQRGYYGTQSAEGGLGAKVQGSFTLAAGTQLSVLVPGGGGVFNTVGSFGGGGTGSSILNSSLATVGQAGAGGGRALVSTGRRRWLSPVGVAVVG
jgi:hypothetical protein